uniref:CDP-L-ribitol pyrophosphorylase A n=1 Tax=Oryzias sinensis TaxID=183150 RepID=A0A8C7WUI8_9TELE
LCATPPPSPAPANPGVFLDGRAGKGDTCSGEPSVDFPVSVVLPAGGTGERTGLHTPKQFCSLLGRPLISYTIQAFERVSWIQRVVVVVAKENMGLMADIIQRFQHHKVLVVSGGSTRHRSICNGVLALDEEGTAPDRPRVVIIHDAVRPFVEEGFLREIAVAAKDHGAAGAIRPLVSTVIATTSEGFLDHSLERAKYRASEMPQGFTHHVIRQAYQRVRPAPLGASARSEAAGNVGSGFSKATGDSVLMMDRKRFSFVCCGVMEFMKCLDPGWLTFALEELQNCGLN